MTTTGFKADGSLFEEYLSSSARAAGSGERVSYVRDRGIWHDMSQGPLERTGNQFDIAIDGKGFLAVQTPRGERYTRNGGLQVNSTGQLVTADGNPVLGAGGPIVLQPNDRQVMISPDGTVSVREGNSRSESIRGRIRVVDFANPQALQKDGGALFRAPNGVTGQDVATPRIVQGAVEKSNVRGVAEMSRMIEITRAYTQIAAMLDQQGNQSQQAIDKLAEVPN
jgi:flagellar basal-body rod protein FlgF